MKITIHVEREPEWYMSFVILGLSFYFFHPSHSDVVMGAAIFLFAVFRLTALTINGRAHWTPNARRVGSAFGVCLFVAFAIRFAVLDNYTTEIITYLICALIEFRNTVWMGRNIGVTKRVT